MGAYVKRTEERTSPKRLGETWESIEQEFRTLKALHDIAPNRVVEPYELIYEEGRAVGYRMERVEAPIFQGAICLDQADKLYEIIDALEETIELFHEQDVAHGDLSRTNIFVDDLDRSSFLIADPVGIPPGYDRLPEAKEHDQKRLLGLRRKLSHSLKSRIGFDRRTMPEWSRGRQKKVLSHLLDCLASKVDDRAERVIKKARASFEQTNFPDHESWSQGLRYLYERAVHPALKQGALDTELPEEEKTALQHLNSKGRGVVVPEKKNKNARKTLP